MTAAPLLSQLSAAKNGFQLSAAKNGFEDAQIALCCAVTAHAEARRGLELAEAYKLCNGVDGRNEAQRTAKRLDLGQEHAALCEAEDALTEARCAYEVARLEWDLARYSVRVHMPETLQDAA